MASEMIGAAVFRRSLSWLIVVLMISASVATSEAWGASEPAATTRRIHLVVTTTNELGEVFPSVPLIVLVPEKPGNIAFTSTRVSAVAGIDGTAEIDLDVPSWATFVFVIVRGNTLPLPDPSGVPGATINSNARANSIRKNFVFPYFLRCGISPSQTTASGTLVIARPFSATGRVLVNGQPVAANTTVIDVYGSFEGAIGANGQLPTVPLSRAVGGLLCIGNRDDLMWKVLRVPPSVENVNLGDIELAVAERTASVRVDMAPSLTENGKYRYISFGSALISVDGLTIYDLPWHERVLCAGCKPGFNGNGDVLPKIPDGEYYLIPETWNSGKYQFAWVLNAIDRHANLQDHGIPRVTLTSANRTTPASVEVNGLEIEAAGVVVESLPRP